MSLRKPISTCVVLLLAISALGNGSTTIPRSSPELVINQPAGRTTLLSSYRGKVVMVAFLFLRSPKCMELATTMNKLNAELGPRGFQPVAIAFPAPQSDASAELVGSMAEYLKLTYPFGYTSKETVDQYLGREERELLRVPQVLIIDQSGVIRAQTGGKQGNLALEDESYLRALIEQMLGSRTK